MARAPFRRRMGHHARVGVVGPTRASVDSTAPNPHIGASESTNLQFPIPSHALAEQAGKKQRSTTSVGSGLRDLPPKDAPKGYVRYVAFSSNKDIGLQAEQ